jgi:pimeloyl-ACP methyl ester carboxylesterase
VPAVPNRGLAQDAASVRAVVESIDSPVVLAGHSYGGAVITVAGVADNVIGLVYVCGHALEVGESLGQLQDAFAGSASGVDLVRTPCPVIGGLPGTDVRLTVGAFSRLAADGVDPRVAEVLAVSQRPLAVSALTEAASVAAWRTKPGWGVVATADRVVHPDVQRFGYRRAALRDVVEIDGPHLVAYHAPDQLSDVIETAVEQAG